jgi:hypothetical protein
VGVSVFGNVNGCVALVVDAGHPDFSTVSHTIDLKWRALDVYICFDLHIPHSFSFALCLISLVTAMIMYCPKMTTKEWCIHEFLSACIDPTDTRVVCINLER